MTNDDKYEWEKEIEDLDDNTFDNIMNMLYRKYKQEFKRRKLGRSLPFKTFDKSEGNTEYDWDDALKTLIHFQY